MVAMACSVMQGGMMYPGDVVVAMQSVAIALAVALAYMSAAVVISRVAGLARRPCMVVLSAASVASIVLTWMMYAWTFNEHVWRVVQLWAVVGIHAQALGHVILSLVLARLWIPTAYKTAAVGPRQRAAATSPPPAPAERTVADEIGGSARLRQPTVFISYRRSDSGDVTGRIHDRLAARLGRERVFTDVDSIPLGVDFRAHVSGILDRTDCMLVVIGRDWLSAADGTGRRRLDDPADLVRVEIEVALARGLPVIPLLVQGAAMPSEDDLPTSIRDLAFRN